MGVTKYVGNKLLGGFLVLLGVVFLANFSISTLMLRDNPIWAVLGIVAIIAGVYYWKHKPFH